MLVWPSWEGAEPGAHLEGERLQDVSLDGGGQQDDGRLGVVLVPVDVDALTLQQLQAALIWKHLNTAETRLQLGEFHTNVCLYFPFHTNVCLILR